MILPMPGNFQKERIIIFLALQLSFRAKMSLIAQILSTTNATHPIEAIEFRRLGHFNKTLRRKNLRNDSKSRYSRCWFMWHQFVWPHHAKPPVSDICERSIDRKLEAMIQEKGDAAELVLDGNLLGEHSSEVNLAELLDIARKEFAEGGTIVTLDEKELEREWPPLRSELNAAVCRWKRSGLELLGIQPNTSMDIPKAQTSEPSRFYVSKSRELHFQDEDFTLFSGLPLFEFV